MQPSKNAKPVTRLKLFKRGKMNKEWVKGNRLKRKIIKRAFLKSKNYEGDLYTFAFLEELFYAITGVIASTLN